MHTRLSRLCATTVLSATLACAGCAATTPSIHKESGRHSDALRITHAAGLKGTRDIPRDKYEKAIKEARAQNTGNDSPSVAGATVFGAANFFSPPPGFSSAGAGVMGFLSWLAPPPKGPEERYHIFAWVPSDLANSSTAAAEFLRQKVKKAVLDTLTTGAVQPVEREGWHNPPLGKYYKYALFAAPDCPEVTSERRGGYREDCSGTLSVTISTTVPWGKFDLGHKDHIDPSRQAIPAPEFLRPANTVYGPFEINVTTSGKLWARKPWLEYNLALGAVLPAWVYIYLPPSDTKSLPVLLRNGQTLYFIESPPAAAAQIK